MEYKWLNKQDNKKLIVFFNGLGMDENVVKHLDTEDYDVVMFYDYNNLDTDFRLEEYEEKYLVAWSMGVMVGTRFFLTPHSGSAHPLLDYSGEHNTLMTSNPHGFSRHCRVQCSYGLARFRSTSPYRKSAFPQGAREQGLLGEIDSATAINGTLAPIDAKFGINPRIYDLTIKGFDSEKFIQNMFDITPSQPSPSGEGVTKRESDNQKSELAAIKNYSANKDFKYTKVLISDNDKIIPTKSQCAYWRIEPNLRSGHCPFYLFKKWSELL